MAVGRAINSIEHADESTFGSLSSGIPDASGLSFTAIEALRAEVNYNGQEEPVAPMEVTRAGPHEYPAEIISPWDSGNGVPYQRRTGTLRIVNPVRNVGDGTTFATHDAWWMTRMLETLYEVSPASGAIPASKTDAVGGVAITANQFTPTDATAYSIGQLISCVISGVVEYASVVDVDAGGPTVTVSPAFSRALTNASGDVVRLGRTYYIPNTLGAPTGSSAAFRYAFGARSFVAFGCRLANHVFRFQDGALQLEGNYPSPCIRDDSVASAAVNPSLPRNADGRVVKPAQMRPAYAVLSAEVDDSAAAPQALSRNVLAVREWTITVNAEMSPTGGMSSILEYPELELTNLEVRAEVTCDANDTLLASMRRIGMKRNLLLGCGPHNEGMGFAAFLPGAHIVDTVVPDMTGPQALHRVTFAAGSWTGDDSTSAPARTCFRIFFPR